MKKKYMSLPLLPLRDVVIYPNMVVPLFVGRELSIKSLDDAMNNHEKNIVLVTQKSAQVDDPNFNDLYKIGTVANILQLLKLPDGTMKVLVEGTSRVEINKVENDNKLTCTYSDIKPSDLSNDNQSDALFRTLEDTFSNYVKLNKKVPPEVISSITGIDDLSKLADSIAAHMTLKLEEKQQVLELTDIKARCEFLIKSMEGELDILHVEKKIRSRVKQQMEKSQREYYLNEQMKAIQKELGEIGDESNDLDQLLSKIKALKLPNDANDKAMSEFNKLKMMSPMSAEATVVRNYLDILVNLPWNQSTEISTDMNRAFNVLEEDHHGLEKVKERVLEYLAVTKRVNKIRGPILCLVGPPGVGKTSLAKSIARATSRKFIKMSLGCLLYTSPSPRDA